MCDMDQFFGLSTHNGIVTVLNPKSGEHRTFRVRTQKKDAKFAPGQRILSLLIGPENESDYLQIGFVKDDGYVALWRRYQTDQYRKLVRVLQEPDHYREKFGFKYNYEGRCRVCNRLLTTPTSVERGIGPKCEGRE